MILCMFIILCMLLSLLFLLLFFSKISFQLFLSCEDRIDNLDEGIEFSVRLQGLSEEWIPVRLIYRGGNSDARITIGSRNPFNIRGYDVKKTNIGNSWRKIEVKLCDIEGANSIQFRWLQTTVFYAKIVRDVWVLDDIVVTDVARDNNMSSVMCDNFQGRELK